MATTKSPATAAAALAVAFLLLASSAAAHDIAKILGQFSDLTSFRDLLVESGLDAEINRRQTITVLAVDNSDIDAISGRPIDLVKRILSVHVVLDYYDKTKLMELADGTALLTTLYQTTGFAAGKTGFLNASVLDGSQVAFGSAAADGFGANLVKEVALKPYNISVLQISDIIVPPGIENTKQAPAQPTPAAAAPKTAPTPAAAAAPKKAETPAAAAPTKAASAPAKAAQAPTNAASAPTKAAPAPTTTTSPSPSAAKAPAASTPAPSDDSVAAPTSDAPEASAPVSEAPAAAGPLAADVEAEAPGPAARLSSGAARVAVGTGLAVAMGAAIFATL